MQLPLTALVLRSGVTPANAFTESFRGAVDLRLWSAGNLERIEADDVELPLAARADELGIALLDRPADQPAWQQFLNRPLARRSSPEPPAPGAPSSSVLSIAPGL
jgi:hypothetical protein